MNSTGEKNTFCLAQSLIFFFNIISATAKIDFFFRDLATRLGNNPKYSDLNWRGANCTDKISNI